MESDTAVQLNQRSFAHVQPLLVRTSGPTKALGRTTHLFIAWSQLPRTRNTTQTRELKYTRVSVSAQNLLDPRPTTRSYLLLVERETK